MKKKQNKIWFNQKYTDIHNIIDAKQKLKWLFLKKTVEKIEIWEKSGHAWPQQCNFKNVLW